MPADDLSHSILPSALQLLAEEWLKSTHPLEAQMRELGLEWRDRPMSDAQVMFCERYGVVYDREWTRGTANTMIDKFVVEVKWRLNVEHGARCIFEHAG